MGTPRAGAPLVYGTASPGGSFLAFVPGETGPAGTRPPEPLDRVRQAIQACHDRPRTGKTPVGSIRRFIPLHGLRHPATMAHERIGDSLSCLAERGKASASTRSRAPSALLSLCREVLDGEVPWAGGLVRANDIDCDRNQLVVRGGKGDNDRITLPPATVRRALIRNVEYVRRLHQKDLRRGAGGSELPGGLGEGCPHAGRQWGWPWVLPETRFCLERRNGKKRRHHAHEWVLRHAVRSPADRLFRTDED